MYEVIIVGGGPAGMAAAVYFARQKLHFAMFSGIMGGQAVWSSDVENYLGIHHVQGVTLVEKFQEHLDEYRKAMDLFEHEPVLSITKMDGGFEIKTAVRSYQAKTVLIVTGAEHRKLHVPGEMELFGKGITYCATCEAPLMHEKDVAVIGGGNSAMDASILLAKYARSVTIYTINNELKGDLILKQRCETSPTIHIVPQATTLRFENNDAIDLVYQQYEKECRASYQGVFIEVGLIPNSGMITMVDKNQAGEIIVDSTGKTSVEGLWAAGDVTTNPVKQIAVAVGDGSRAAVEIIRYLQSHPSHL